MFAFLRKVDHTTSRKTRKGRNFHNNRPGFEPLEGRVVLDAAGSTMGTSLNLGAINGQVTHHDSIGFPDSSSPGGIDTIDWYKFTLTAPCPSLNVRLAGLSANADLQVYRDTNNNHVVDSGELLGSSNNPGTAHDVVNLSSQPADNNYYVRVNRVSGETSYTLTLTADYAGNSRQEARDSGTFFSTRVFRDFVGASDTNDFYRINLTTSRTVTGTISGLAADADLQLQNASGNVIASSTNGSTANDSISYLLVRGTYYFRVFQFSGDTNYNFTLTT